MSSNRAAMQLLGKAIQGQRSRIQLSQTELANLAGVSLNFVSQVESGKVTAQIGKVLDVLHSLGMCFSLDYGKNRITSRLTEERK